jgi:hypothetical protein
MPLISNLPFQKSRIHSHSRLPIDGSKFAAIQPM